MRSMKKNRDNPKTVAVATLGCKVNQYETELVREGLTRSGADRVISEEFETAIESDSAALNGLVSDLLAAAGA